MKKNEIGFLRFLEKNKIRWIAMAILDVIIFITIIYVFNSSEISNKLSGISLIYIFLMPIKYLVDYSVITRRKKNNI
ncbi:MAG: hypothetical protein ACRC2A_00390 [Enterobacterales bacterium]